MKEPRIILDQDCTIVKKQYLKVLEDKMDEKLNGMDELEDNFQQLIAMVKQILVDNESYKNTGIYEFVKEHDKKWYSDIELE